jgi:LysM repeat protein
MARPLSADALLKALRDEGLKVVEHSGWRTHNRAGHGAWGPVNGVIIHHTVTSGTDSSVELCYNGHSDLPGPLCHGVIDKAGTVHLVGNGRANHAGGGDPKVLAHVQAEDYDPAQELKPTRGNSNGVDGNAHFYGFEAINLGNGKDPWPAAQLEAIEKTSAAICRAHGWTASSVIAHKEWSSDKIDPRGFSMPGMRDRVADRLQGKASTPPKPAPTPAADEIVPKSRESAATMAKQAAKALADWPFITDVEKAHGLTEGLLLAVGSRETNLTNKTGDKGHGRGVWQLDDRWHPIPADFATNVREQAETAATMLAANYKALKTWAHAIAAYNAGVTGVKNALAAGKSADSATAGGDYAADVLGRQLLLHPAAKPPTSGGGASSSTTYTVKKGDTLTAIAKAHGTTVAKLVSLNKLKDADEISVGQKLKLVASTPSTPAYEPFPGSAFFHGGRHSPIITALGRRLVALGFGQSYKSGPGPNWTNADRAAVRAFQVSKAELKGDADGIPGPKTWAALKIPKV